MLKSVFYRLSKWLRRIYGPRMINYKKNFQNKHMKNLRIGNTTFIDCAENLVVADNVYIGHHNFIEASNGIDISEGCQITSFISITSHSSHNSVRIYGNNYSNFQEHHGYQKGPVKIGKFTFIGPHVTIMPYTSIGDGCIISAYSYVKGDFPSYSIIAGNPAKVVGSTKDIDEKLLKERPDLEQYYMK